MTGTHINDGDGLPVWRVPAVPLVAVLLVAAGCSLGVSSTLGGPVLRPAVDVPARFVLDPAAPMASDTIPGTGCRSPLYDPRDSTLIRLTRSASGRGDYEAAAGRYGVRAGELLRIDCRTGASLGIVLR